MSDRLPPPDAPRSDGAAFDDVAEVLLFPDALGAEELEALRSLVNGNAVVGTQARTLARAEALLRDALDAELPDRHVLVLHALEASGRSSCLEPEEQARLNAARPALDRLLTALPGLGAVMRRIVEDAEVFELCWGEALRQRRAADRPARAGRSRWLWRVSVGMAVVAFAAVSVMLFRREGGMTTTTADAAGTVVLSDGTTVRLARGARLTYPDPRRADRLKRRVRLSGDAFFSVTPSTKDFSVETAAGRIAVLGTVFGIRATDTRTEVTLVDGSLALEGRGRTVELAPGQQSAVLRGQAPSSPTPVQVNRALAWSGLYVFRDTPLGEALAQLAEGHGLEITTTAALRAQQVTGTFEAAQPLGEILDAVALTLGVGVARTAQGYRIG